jgi:hypothetical protein
VQPRCNHDKKKRAIFPAYGGDVADWQENSEFGLEMAETGPKWHFCMKTTLQDRVY